MTDRHELGLYAPDDAPVDERPQKTGKNVVLAFADSVIIEEHQPMNICFVPTGHIFVEQVGESETKACADKIALYAHDWGLQHALC